MKPPVASGPGPLLVFGGAYSNLSATEAMMSVANELGISAENCICTGDIIAYCARPAATLRAIRHWGCHLVMGNCEESLAANASDCGCGFDEASICSTLSDDWYRFASKKISPDEREWMSLLPRELRFEWNGLNIYVTHGSPSRINRFIFASTEEQVKRTEIERTGCQVILAGHCGIPFGQSIDITNQAPHFWLNAGAIGMPANDGTSDGWYMLLEPLAERVRVSWHRLSYDYQPEQQNMRSEGLGNDYADALQSGLWPSMDVLPDRETAQQGVLLQPTPLMIEPLHH